MNKILLLSLSIFIIAPTILYAHPGKTDSSGCHVCRTNCEKYGYSYGEKHCH